MSAFHAFKASANPRQKGICVSCGRPESHQLHALSEKTILVNPADRAAAEPVIAKLDLPVQESAHVPRGKMYVLDPEALQDLPDVL